MIKYILMNLEYLSFVYIILGLKFRTHKTVSRISIMVLLFIVLEVLEKFLGEEQESILKSIYIFFVWLNCYLLFELKFQGFFKLIMIAYPCMAILENPFYYLAGVFLFDNSYFQTITSEINLILVFFGIFLIRRGKRGFLSFFDPAWKFLIAILWIMALMMTYFLAVLEYVSALRAKVAGISIFILGSLAVDVLIFALLRYLNRVRTGEVEMAFMEGYHEQQRDYFMKLLDREQETKKFRHDLSNELMQLQSYSKHGEYEELQSFLEEMIHDFQRMQKKIMM